ncbi:uridine kinase family protein [Georgenia sp. Z1491]|uniref:uridine kinase family protein n=1 Tax=Georgenia sp. Z1491 TaxID=3416707 RepID=UPI003CEEB1D0
MDDDARPPTDAPVGAQEPLFDIPDAARTPLARVVLVTGPSGSGKTRLTRRLGLPTVALDDFYLDGDHPGLPRRHGMVDWDSPESWDGSAAVASLVELVTTGAVEVPVYDIPSNARVGSRIIELGTARAVVAEGIFAAEIVGACRAEGILADALCLTRPRLQTFVFRLARDLDEGRKPPLNLLRRGLSLTLAEPAMYRDLVAKGTRRVTVDDAERTILRVAAGLPPEPADV